MRNITFIRQVDSSYLFGKGRGKDKGKRRTRLKNFLAGKSKEFGLSKKIQKFENSIPTKRSFLGKIVHDTGVGAKVVGGTGAVLGAGVFAALN